MASIFFCSKVHKLTHFLLPFYVTQQLEGARLDGANLLGAIR